MILTEDTHHEDGYVCADCPEVFQDQLSNVTLCTDRRTAEFLRWCQNQEFYENTTIVISGDHLTMDSDFCRDVDPSYQRKVFTAYINTAAQRRSQKVRQYSTFDDFPTILAAMGVEIEGDKLGLGVNLYSEESTLVEQYGISWLNKELSKQSDFMRHLIR
jgi:phosphoglycerol transferase